MANAYKLLMCGKSNIVIDEFYNNFSDEFDVLTTSMRYRDMSKHVNLFQPDLMLYICQNLQDADFKKVVELQRHLQKYNTTFVILGSKEECAEFQRVTGLFPDLILIKPITYKEVSAKISDTMHEKTVSAGRLEKLARMSQAEPEPEPERRKHVLVIDDDPLMLKLIKEYLHTDYDVATAVSGKIAYKFLETKSTDLILLDYEMPEENGPEVFLNIRTRGFKDLPIIFLTGVTDSERVKDVIALQPQGYVLKPVDKAKLLNAVNGILKK